MTRTAAKNPKPVGITTLTPEQVQQLNSQKGVVVLGTRDVPATGEAKDLWAPEKTHEFLTRARRVLKEECLRLENHPQRDGRPIRKKFLRTAVARRLTPHSDLLDFCKRYPTLWNMVSDPETPEADIITMHEMVNEADVYVKTYGVQEHEAPSA